MPIWCRTLLWIEAEAGRWLRNGFLGAQERAHRKSHCSSYLQVEDEFSVMISVSDRS